MIRELLVALDLGALRTDRGAAVDPVGGFEQGAGLRDLGGGEDVGNGVDHGRRAAVGGN